MYFLSHNIVHTQPWAHAKCYALLSAGLPCNTLAYGESKYKCTFGISHKTLCCSLLWLIVLLVGVVLFIVLAFHAQSYQTDNLAYEGDTLKLSSANAFWYNKFRVAEHLESGDYGHEIHFVHLLCHDIHVHNYNRVFNGPSLYLSHATRLMAEVQYLYLLQKSTVIYNICLGTNGTVYTAGLFVFDSQRSYYAFVDDDSSGKGSAVMHKSLGIGTFNRPICSEVKFTAEKPAYYFITVESPGDLYYQYNVSKDVRYLNYSDYEQYTSCSLREGESCEIPIDNNFFGSAEDICLLSYASPYPPYAPLPPTTHIKVDVLKRYQVLIIPALLIALGLIGLSVLCVLVAIRCREETKRSRMGYVPIQ